MPRCDTDSSLFCCVPMHGIKINRSSMDNALSEVEKLIAQHNQHYVCFFEANLFHRSMQENNVRDVINHASLIYPDGVAPAFAASLCSGQKFTRVSGPSFLLKACEYGLSRNWRHYFLGGAEGVADKLVENLKKQFPGIQIAGTFCPPFRTLTEQEEAEIKQKIESSLTDLLWVGLGGPKQEFWMQAHLGKINVPVMLGVGAAFDFHSGNRPWAPKIVRGTGLEWFWRMLSGGQKTFIRNFKCVSHVSWILVKDILLYKVLRRPVVKMQSRFPQNR